MDQKPAVTFAAPTAAVTLAAGRALAAVTAAGDIILCTGPLGAGKTVFARGLARGHGYRGAVRSPTYTLVREYEVPAVRMAHMDLYRLADDIDELYHTGFWDYVNRGDLVFIEWADRLPGGARRQLDANFAVDLAVTTPDDRATDRDDAASAGDDRSRRIALCGPGSRLDRYEPPEDGRPIEWVGREREDG